MAAAVLWQTTGIGASEVIAPAFLAAIFRAYLDIPCGRWVSVVVFGLPTGSSFWSWIPILVVHAPLVLVNIEGTEVM
jgi:hypothetical protein